MNGVVISIKVSHVISQFRDCCVGTAPLHFARPCAITERLPRTWSFITNEINFPCIHKKLYGEVLVYHHSHGVSGSWLKKPGSTSGSWFVIFGQSALLRIGFKRIWSSTGHNRLIVKLQCCNWWDSCWEKCKTLIVTHVGWLLGDQGKTVFGLQFKSKMYISCCQWKALASSWPIRRQEDVQI